MEQALTVFFSMLAGGGVFWCVLEVRDYRRARIFLRAAADEQTAQEGMRRMRQLDAEAIMDSATVYDPPRSRHWPYR